MYVTWEVLMYFSTHLPYTTHQLCSHFPVYNILCCKNTVLLWGSMDFTVLGVSYNGRIAACCQFGVVKSFKMFTLSTTMHNGQYPSRDSIIFFPSGNEHLPTTQTYTIWLWQIRKSMNIHVYIYVWISALYEHFPVSLWRLLRYVL